MKKSNKILLGLIILSSQTGLHAMDPDIQNNTITEQQIDQASNCATAKSNPLANAQSIANTIQTVANVVETASNLINQVAPATTSVGITGQQTNQSSVTTTAGSSTNAQNIVNTINTIVSSVETANDLIDQILPADNLVETDAQTINILSQDEMEKWKYINQYFTTNLNPTTSSQKIGIFIDEYANYLTMPTIMMYVMLSEKLLTHLETLFSNATTQAASQATSTPTATQAAAATAPAATTTTSTKLGSAGRGGMQYIVSPIVGGLISYKILKYISNLMQQKTATCNAVLINFVQNWDQNKAHTPAILCDFFESLNQELIATNGKLISVDALLAQKIVEAIVSTSTLINSAINSAQ